MCLISQKITILASDRTITFIDTVWSAGSCFLQDAVERDCVKIFLILVLVWHIGQDWHIGIEAQQTRQFFP